MKKCYIKPTAERYTTASGEDFMQAVAPITKHSYDYVDAKGREDELEEDIMERQGDYAPETMSLW